MQGQQKQHEQDIAAVKAVVEELIAAWGRHDAEAYGALFTQDATYTTYVGTFYQGRRDIVESHRTLFAKFLKDTQLADEILDIRFYGPDVAVVNGRGDTYKGRRPRKLSKVQTYTLIRENGSRWRIAAFHNTRRKPLMEAMSYKFAPGLIPAADR
ncbi:SgcJ/EcaC family oxidoreductase [Streptomyces sp. bgisy084]|uniref:SgcJ/EcaC family oxidoreductase n=1 Tax=unclassified Streptomyces TaxID=2593676 RepID=UPI003D706B54